MVYFLQSIDGGPVKIGFSTDVDRRREQLEAIYGTPLAVLATLDGGRDEEQALHARFSHLRLGRTEQFRPDAELMAFIGRPLLVDQNSESVDAMPSKAKPMVLQVRGSDEFKAWFDELARFDGLSSASLFSRAMKMYAREIGFSREAPSR